MRPPIPALAAVLGLSLTSALPAMAASVSIMSDSFGIRDVAGARRGL